MRRIRHTALCLCLLSLATMALANTATNNTTWQTKANSVCAQLQTAMTAYQNQNLQQAHVNAVMAYFQNYDLNIEPAARQYFDQGHIFDIEQRFSSLNKSIIANPNVTQLADVKQQAQNLCQIVMDDAKHMDNAAVNPPPAES